MLQKYLSRRVCIFSILWTRVTSFLIQFYETFLYKYFLWHKLLLWKEKFPHRNQCCNLFFCTLSVPFCLLSLPLHIVAWLFVNMKLSRLAAIKRKQTRTVIIAVIPKTVTNVILLKLWIHLNIVNVHQTKSDETLWKKWEDSNCSITPINLVRNSVWKPTMAWHFSFYMAWIVLGNQIHWIWLVPLKYLVLLFLLSSCVLM